MALRLLNKLNRGQTLRLRLNIDFLGTNRTIFYQNFSTLCKQTSCTITSKTNIQSSQTEIRNKLFCSHNIGLLSSLTQYSKFTTSSKFYQNEDYYKNEDGYLIYTGESGFSIKVALASMYTIGGTMLAVTPMMMERVSEYPYLPAMFLSLAAVFGLANPTIFYLVCRRYVQELYYDHNADKYTALVPSPFIFGNKKISFKAKDCSMPANMTLFSSFLVRGKPLFINSDMMDYGAYSKMLRKAIEFDYENPDRQSQYEASVESSLKRLKEREKKK